MVLFQLYFIHPAGIPLHQGDKLRYCRKGIIHSADVGGAHHVIIGAIQSVAHQRVQLRAKQEVARKALRVEIQKALAHAGCRHVAVFVPFPVPAVEQEVRANFHQGKHSRLGQLAGHGPVQLLARPVQFSLIRCAGLYRARWAL